MHSKDGISSFDWRGVRAMVFDMDGTLLNTEYVIVQAASHALVHLGHAPLPEGYHMPNMFGTAADLMLDAARARCARAAGRPRRSGGAVRALLRGAAFWCCAFV
nr:HAD hydrolase-like protein [Comamonas jiangduensis]